MRLALITLMMLAMGSCTPAKAPTALDAAALAVAATDAALAVAIDAQSGDAGSPVWDQRVEAVERAADAIRTAQDVCPMLPALAALATDLQCPKCSAALVTAKEQLKCQQ